MFVHHFAQNGGPSYGLLEEEGHLVLPCGA